AADNAHARFADPTSEFIGILKLWNAYREAHEELTQSKLRAWCERHFLGFLRMREWRELHRQLLLATATWPKTHHRGQTPDSDPGVRPFTLTPDSDPGGKAWGR